MFFIWKLALISVIWVVLGLIRTKLSIAKKTCSCNFVYDLWDKKVLEYCFIVVDNWPIKIDEHSTKSSRNFGNHCHNIWDVIWKLRIHRDVATDENTIRNQKSSRLFIYFSQLFFSFHRSLRVGKDMRKWIPSYPSMKL